MVKKVFKLIIFFLFIITGSFLWTRRKPSPISLERDAFDSKIPSFGSCPGVLILFNSGGWGNTALEEAEDFRKVIIGIKTTINKFGFKAAIVSYGRTKDNFWGRIRGMKQILTSFGSRSEKLMEQIDTFLEHNPGSKVLMAGLSLGANFVNETMKKIGEQPSVLAIKAGTPFWVKNLRSKNILGLIDERDVLAKGDYKTLLSIGMRGIIKWIAVKFRGRRIFFSEAIRVPGHKYDWESVLVRKEIISFLESNFRNPDNDKNQKVE